MYAVQVLKMGQGPTQVILYSIIDVNTLIPVLFSSHLCIDVVERRAE